MSRLKYPSKDPTDLLNSLFEKSFEENENKSKKTIVWKTPYGVSFLDYGMGVFWFYRYDDDIGDLLNEDSKLGSLSGNDIIDIIEQLKVNPNKLKEKPDSVKQLEELTGKKAFRKENYFGGWHLVDGSAKYSMFNNPFSVETGYTDSENNFEVWFMKKEKEQIGYQTIDEIKNGLSKYGYI